MHTSEPKVPEDFYKLFIKGMPLKPVTPIYAFKFRRKGWNISTYHVDTTYTSFIDMELYTAISTYYPDWKLRVYKYVGKN